jgi:hypothetical protein
MGFSLEALAVVSAAMFAGGALYISLVEHPARLKAGVAVALAEFRPSYHRAAPWQVSTALISLVAGVGAALFTGRWAWAIGGLAVSAAIPLTLVFIMPTTRRLLGAAPIPADEAARLLDRWGCLHWGRSVLGVLGLVIMVFAALAR